jgi:K(+)-stimulated pyrophosphate-energized sodium pump
MGAEALGAYMAGVLVSGVLWAIFQNNAGGAWDNAKKSFEAGVMIDGEMTYKGSEAHKAAVTGDTVGDPFKDTSGPSMNILIKLTCLVGLVIAPILGEISGNGHAMNHDTQIEESYTGDAVIEIEDTVVDEATNTLVGEEIVAIEGDSKVETLLEEEIN